MTPEEYKRFKEAEKEHLRALKKLKETVHQLKRRKSVNQALDNMVSGAKETFDVHEEMVDKLAIETARHEARLEIAMENTALEETLPGETPMRSPEELEEELLKERAMMLLQQMKLQMGMATTMPQEETPSKTLSRHAVQKRPPAATETPTSETGKKPSPPVDRPEKTIGRMK